MSSCSSPSSSEAGSDGLNLTFANYTEAGPVFHATTVKLQEQLKEHADSGVSVDWFDNQGDPTKMLENARLMVQTSPDVIIEYPVAEDSVGVQKVFKEADIPCIALNLPLAGCSWINIDNPKMGESAAKLASAEAKKRGWTEDDTTVLIGQNATAGPSVNGNITRFFEVFADEFGLEPVAEADITPSTSTIGKNGVQFDGKSDQDVSFTAVRALLAGLDPDRNLVLYACNDDQTLGAYRAIKDAGRSDNVIVIGHGGGRIDTLEALRDDPNWIGQDVFFEDYWGQYTVAMAEAIVAGKELPELTLLPSLTIGKDELFDYFDKETLELTKLPPLDDTNSYMADSDFLKRIDNIDGLK
ncbi:hypothetical protein GCM10025778_21310 [Paeniglutamicibacter antarcticus]|uniref:Periplasmic binding protein domain-containing protein n=1 Tax=Paeniglutamicibacter antarcticus TaxID=494023 RepID=A0ABP9TMZ6_9MICC